MGKLFKILVGSLLTLATIVVVSAVILMNFVNTDKLKTSISQAIYKETGYQITVNGPIHWRIYPTIALQLSDLQILGNQTISSRPLASIKEANFAVQLKPLFRGDVQIDAISLHQPTLYLTKNARGKGNWEVTTPENKKIEKKNNIPSYASKTAPEKNKSIHKFNIEKISVKDGVVTWQNQQNNQQWKINNLQFTTPLPTTAQVFPISLNFDIQNKTFATNPHIELTSQVTMDPQKQTYALSNVRLKIDNSTITGNMNITQAIKPNVKFNLSVDSLDIDRYFAKEAVNPQDTAATNNDKSLLAYDNNPPSTTPITVSKGLPIEFLKMISMRGDIQIQTFTFNKITMTNVKASIDGGNGLLKVTPLTANAYEAQFNNQIVLNAQQSTSSWNFVSTANNISVGKLLMDLTNKKSLEGTGEYYCNLQAQGANTDQITNTLNGQMRFAINNGKLKQLNILKTIQAAVALFKQQPIPQSNGDDDTDFSHLTMIANVNNGIMQTNDLTLTSPILKVTGEGIINLRNKTIDMKLLANLTGAEVNPTIRQLQETAGGIPLHVTGTLNEYHVTPDQEAITIAIAKYFIKKQTGNIEKTIGEGTDKLKEKTEKLQNKLRDILGN